MFLRPESLLLLPIAILTLYLCTRRARLVRDLLRIHSLRDSHRLMQIRTVTCFLVFPLIIVALSRPLLGSETLVLSSSTQNVFIMLDVSLSMNAQDGVIAGETRLHTAVRKLRDLSHLIEQKSSGTSLSIVIFAGNALTLTPLTNDYKVLRDYIDLISTSLLSATGSSAQAAFDELARVSELRSEDLLTTGRGNDEETVVFVVSDGELDEDMEELLPRLRSLRAKLFALIIGSEAGTPLYFPDGSPVRNSDGSQAITTAMLQPLEQLAQQTGGQTATATLNNRDLESLLSSAFRFKEGLEESKTREVSVHRELGPYLAASALLLFLFFAIVSRHRVSLFGIIFLSLSLQPEAALAHSPPELYEARRHFDRESYNKALELYQEEKHANSFDGLFGAGASAYGLERYEEAASLFTRAANRATDPESIFRSHFNAGNAHLQRGDPAAAISSYNKALSAIPNERKALFNRELAERLLSETDEPRRGESDDNNESQGEDTRRTHRELEDGVDEPKSEQEMSSDMPTDNFAKESATSNDAATPHALDAFEEKQKDDEMRDFLEQQEAARRWLENVSEPRLLYRPLEPGERRSPRW